MSLNRFIVAALGVFVAGCVTINIYFPEAEAEQAADRIIDEVRGSTSEGAARLDLGEFARIAAAGVLDLLVPTAAAQANFDAESPASRALEQSLKQRFPGIKPYLDSGAVGLTAGGLLDIRDRNAIPLSERNRVRQLVAEQNGDWEALYQEIARINGHPEWVDQIRQVFADRWVAKAAPGWFYRDAGGVWKQK